MKEQNILFIVLIVCGLGLLIQFLASHRKKHGQSYFKFQKIGLKTSVDTLNINEEQRDLNCLIGERIRVRVEGVTEKDVQIQSLSIKYKVEEIASRTGRGAAGREFTTETDAMIRTDGTKITGNYKYTSGVPFSWDLELELPDDLPPTYVADNNQIKWTCIISAKISRLITWKQEIPLAVVPVRFGKEHPNG